MQGPVLPRTPCSCRGPYYLQCCPFFVTSRKQWPRACSGFHIKVDPESKWRYARVRCKLGLDRRHNH